MKKPSIWYGIFHFKCPRCREGDLFIHKRTYWTFNFLKMHKHCPVCGQTYTPEPGFYFGAAYISYMVSTGIALLAFLVLFFGFDIREPGKLIGVIIALTVLAAPVNFRISRAVWANIFIRYKPRT